MQMQQCCKNTQISHKHTKHMKIALFLRLFCSVINALPLLKH